MFLPEAAVAEFLATVVVLIGRPRERESISQTREMTVVFVVAMIVYQLLLRF